MRCRILLKSGVILEATSRDATKSVIGLWIWCARQPSPTIMHFVELSIMSTEIVSIEEIVDGVVQ